MMDKFPRLRQFSTLYWHQMGPDLYGSAAGALEAFLGDASKLSDGGQEYKRQVLDELTVLSSSFEKLSRDGPNGAFVTFGGCYLFREDVNQLLAAALGQLRRPDA